jgi:tRNA-2-methylthio-N6-dimethylallyladenosine synthase
VTFFIKTFGCQMNVNDSEKMRSLLLQRGLVPAGDETGADIVVVNSCAVRQKAQDKIFSYIGQLPKSATVILAGCVAQAERQEAFRRGRVDFLVGTHQVHRLADIVDEIGAGSRRGAALSFSRRWQELVPAPMARENPVTAFVSIMEGCNNFCSYCIVPFTRGREKHRPLKAVLSEARALSSQGFQEIVLLGQNVNSWRDERAGVTFPGLLERLAKEVEVRWIRFVTSYPGYHDPDLMRVMAEQPRLARHVHFPAQAGSTRTLRRMARVYTRADYLRIVADFRRVIPAMKFSSDFIVGFPGETESDFRFTLSLLERVRYESIFSFIYSPRRYTRAFALVDDTPETVKKERLQRLQALQAEIQLQDNQKLIGTTVEVLVTAAHPRRSGEMIGRSESYRVVNFPSTAAIGSLVWVRVTGAGPHSLRGVEARAITG